MENKVLSLSCPILLLTRSVIRCALGEAITDASVPLFRGGSADRAIVGEADSESLYRYTAEELRRCLAALGSVAPRIITPSEVNGIPDHHALTLVGSPSEPFLVPRATTGAGMRLKPSPEGTRGICK